MQAVILKEREVFNSAKTRTPGPSLAFTTAYQSMAFTASARQYGSENVGAPDEREIVFSNSAEVNCLWLI